MGRPHGDLRKAQAAPSSTHTSSPVGSLQYAVLVSPQISVSKPLCRVPWNSPIWRFQHGVTHATNQEGSKIFFLLKKRESLSERRKKLAVRFLFFCRHIFHHSCYGTRISNSSQQQATDAHGALHTFARDKQGCRYDKTKLPTLHPTLIKSTAVLRT